MKNKIRTDQAVTLLEETEIHQHIVSSIMNSTDDKSVLREAKRFKQFLDRYWKKILERRMKGVYIHRVTFHPLM